MVKVLIDENISPRPYKFSAKLGFGVSILKTRGIGDEEVVMEQ
jgi:hypothetical protein